MSKNVPFFCLTVYILCNSFFYIIESENIVKKENLSFFWEKVAMIAQKKNSENYTLKFDREDIVRIERDVKQHRHLGQIINFMMILVFYQIVFNSFDKSRIEKTINILRYVYILTLIVCVLQYFNLSQFWHMIYTDPWNPERKYLNNSVVGFIFNPTHLSTCLAMMMPVLWIKNNLESLLATILSLIVLCFLTGTTKGDPAVSGIIIVICLLFYWLYYTHRKTFFVLCILSIILCAFIFIKGSIFNPKSLFFDGGRIALWKFYWPHIYERPIFGNGLGSFRHDSVWAPGHLQRYKNLHFEYYQIVYELGLAGLSLLFWCLLDFFKIKPENKTEMILKFIFTGFCISCLFNFSAHLWLLSIYAMFAYAGFLNLKITERA